MPPVTRDGSSGDSAEVEPAAPPLRRRRCRRASAVSSSTVRSAFFCPIGADAAHDVPGGPLGQLRVGHVGALAAHGGRQRLEVELARDRHDADDEGAVDVGEQRLEDLLVREAEHLGGLEPVRRPRPGRARRRAS